MEIYQNETVKYLFPTLVEYGDEFVEKINSFYKVFVGIGDLKRKDFDIGKPELYILFHVQNNQYLSFFQFLKEVRQLQFYVDDYTYHEDIRNTEYIVLVLSIPEIHKEAYYKFKKGQYSIMYTEEQILKLYGNADTMHTKILRKDVSMEHHITKRIQEEYGVSKISFSNPIIEYELPPNFNKEILNTTFVKEILKNKINTLYL